MFNDIKDKFTAISLGLLLSLVFVPSVLAADVTIVGVGDMVCEFSDPATPCRQISRRLSNQTSIINPQFVLPLGDLQYVDGEYSKFVSLFDADWGTLKPKMKPVPGNHEYNTAGAAGYYTYFGPQATGVNGNGYYSWDAGDWHMIALNSEVAINEQVTWLNADLASHPTACTLAYFHRPRFSSGADHGSDPSVAPFWDALYTHGADLVLNGHEHNYERFNLQNPSGVLDTTRGIREFVVGTGGRSFYAFNTPIANSQFRRTNIGGVLKLVLHPTSYDYSLVDENGNVLDTGSGQCVATAGVTPVPTATPTPVVTSTPPPATTVAPTIVPCGPTNTGQVTMATNLPTGVYKVWARVQTTSTANNFFVRADNTCTEVTNSTGASGWVWISASQTISLSEPNQTITIIGRDDGVKVDKIILTQNLLCVPAGFGENCETEPTPIPTTPPPGTTINPTPTSAEPNPTPTSGPGQGESVTGLQLKPIADARVLDTSPTRNYGSQTNLRVNGIPNGFYREVSNAYLLFDTSSVTRSVESLKLRIYIQGGDSASKNTQNIKLVSNTSWSESSINFNNAPTLGITLATFGPTKTNTWYDINLPANILTPGQARLSLGVVNCTDCRDGLSFASRESSQSPLLIINNGVGGTENKDD